MATTTTRLGLTKPAASENIDVALLNTNADAIDAAMSFRPCTSGTRPGSPYDGQTIIETDTGKAYVRRGASWRQIPVDGAAWTVAGAATVTGSLTVSDDITVTDDVTIGGDLTVTGKGSVQYVTKGSAESVTSSTTIQDDNDMQVTLGVGTYRVEAFISATGAAAGDLKLQWNFAGTASATYRSCVGPAVGSTDATSSALFRSSSHTLANAVTYGTDGTNTTAISEDLLLVVTVGGLLKMQWAQNTSSATSTTLTVSTRMFVTRVV